MSAHWWAISEEAFREALDRVAFGEGPDLIYAEFYANSDAEEVVPAKELIARAIDQYATTEALRTEWDVSTGPTHSLMKQRAG